jgi:hypothetical protein
MRRRELDTLLRVGGRPFDAMAARRAGVGRGGMRRTYRSFCVGLRLLPYILPEEKKHVPPNRSCNGSRRGSGIYRH